MVIFSKSLISNVFSINMLLGLKDRKLIYALDCDARQSFSSLGKTIGVNKNTVQYRVSRLESSGIVKGYYTLIDSSKLGYLVFRVYVRFSHVTEDSEKEIISYLVNHSKVGWVVSVQGSWDLNFMVWVKDHFVFDSLWKEFKFRFKGKIQKEWISLFTKLQFYSRDYLLEPRKGGNNPIALYNDLGDLGFVDDMDISILKVLAKNSRIEFVELALQVGLSFSSARSRVKKLKEKGVIKGFKPILDLEKMGYRYYKIHAKLTAITQKDWLFITSYCHNHPNIFDLNELINGADLEIDVQVKDDVQLRAFISDLRSHLQKYIVDYDVLYYYKEHKFVFFPLD